MKKKLWVFVLIAALLPSVLVACNAKTDTRVIVPDEEENVLFDTTVPVLYDVYREGSVYGTVQAFEYDSTVTGGKKHADVLLPAGYDVTQSYPVVFMYPGHFSDHHCWLTELSAKEIFGNAILDGVLPSCIVVFVNFFMTENEEFAGTVDVFDHDSSAEDVVNCLYPAICQAYSVKPGKENVAVAGYSAGGRATLNIVLQYDDFADHALACEPFYYDETRCVLAGKELSSFLLVKGTKDGIVLDAPYRAHLELQKYHVAHTYFELDFAHEADCWKQSLYLFLNTIFKE